MPINHLQLTLVAISPLPTAVRPHTPQGETTSVCTAPLHESPQVTPWCCFCHSLCARHSKQTEHGTAALAPSQILIPAVTKCDKVCKWQNSLAWIIVGFFFLLFLCATGTAKDHICNCICFFLILFTVNPLEHTIFNGNKVLRTNWLQELH